MPTGPTAAWSTAASTGAVLTDPDEVGRRALSLVARGGVESVTGEWTRVAAETLCIHGDSPGAARTARVVRARR